MLDEESIALEDSDETTVTDVCNWYCRPFVMDRYQSQKIIEMMMRTMD